MKRSALMIAMLVLASRPQAARADDFDTQLMEATFKIANERSTATCFLLTRPPPGQPNKLQFVLVTAGHVFENMTGNEATLFLRRQEGDGVYKKLPLQLKIRDQGKSLWTKHPSADIAALIVAPPPTAELPHIPVDLLASDAMLKRYGVHPGDALKCLGFPHRFEANDAGFPVLSSGPIASYPLRPVRRTKTFLLNFNTFEGDSGGPVYLSESHRLSDERRQLESVNLILGLIVGQHNIDEEVKTLYETRKVRHRLGFAIVVHAAFVRETIDRLPVSERVGHAVPAANGQGEQP
jgi:hypothetical protein